MADDIRLVTTVSMNTKPLERDAATAAAELKALNTALKAQSKEFKQAGADADALAGREKALGEAISKQNEIVEGKKKRLKQVTEAVKNHDAATKKEIKSIENAKNALTKEQYVLRGYERDLQKTTAQKIRMKEASKELEKNLSSMQLKTAKLANEFRRNGDEANALIAEYNGLNKEIEEHSNKIDRENIALTKIKQTMGATSKEYTNQQIVVNKLNTEHIKMLKNQERLSVALNKVSADTDSNNRGIIRAWIATTKFSGALSTSERGWKKYVATLHQASATINRLGSSFRNIGLVIGGMGIGGLIQNISTLVPLAGSLVSVLAGVGGMVASLGGGAIGLGGAFGIAGIAVKLFAGQAQTALQMVEDGEMKATAELSRYKSALDGLKTQWKGLVQSNQGAIFNTMANGIDIARFALTRLNPFITRTANMISTFSNRVKTWVTSSKNAGAAFKLLNTIGPPIFQNILNSVLKVTDGVVHMATKFAPLFTWTAKGLENMANQFNKWANSASTDAGIAKFIEYTKRNLPITGQIFSNVFSGMIDLFIAFGGHSETVMRGMAGVTQSFKDWAANLASTEGFKAFISYLETNGPKVWELLKNLGSILVNLIVGLAPVGAFMLDMAVKFSGFFAALTKYPIVGTVVGILAALVGVIWTFAPVIITISQLVGALGGIAAIAGVIMNPITWIIAGIAALIAGLAWLNTKIEPVNWGRIFGDVGAWFKAKWSQFMAWLKPTWAGMLAWLQIAGGLFKSVWSSIWGGISSVARAAFNGVIMALRWMFNTSMAAMTFFGGIMKTVWSAIWLAIKTVAVWYMNTLKNNLSLIWTAIKTSVMFVFNGIKTFLTWLWNGIKTSVILYATLLRVGVAVAWRILSTVTRTVFGAIKNFVVFIWTTIKNSVVNAARAVWTGVKVAWGWISNGTRSIFNAVRNFIVYIWNNIKVRVVTFARMLWVNVRTQWMLLSKISRAIFSSVRNFIVAVWNNLKNRVVAIARVLWNIVRAVWSALSKGSRAIFSAVRTFIVAVWTNLRNRVVAFSRSLWNIVRGIWNTLSRVSRSIFSSVRNFIVAVWTNLRNRVVAFSRSLWNIVRGIWNSLSKTSKSIFSNVRNYLVSVWVNLRNRVVAFTRSLWNIVRGIWNTLSKVTRNIFSNLRNFLVSLWTNIRNRVTAFARSLWNGVRNTWNGLSKGTRNIFNAVRNYLVDKWNGIKNSVTGIASSLWGSVKKTFTNMKNGIKGLAGKIGDTINGMVSGIKKGLNALIKGVNWVADKLGVETKIPQLHTGTAGASNSVVSNGAISSPTLATVNDKGRGNGTGPNGHQEVIQRADGSMYAPKGKNVTVPLGKGDIVHNGKAVQKAQKAGVLPKFASGTGRNDLLKDAKKKKKKKHDHEHGAFDAIGEKFGTGAGGLKEWAADVVGAGVAKTKQGAKKAGDVLQGAKKAAGNAGNWIKDKATDLLDFVGNPGKLLDKVLGAFGVKFPKVKGQIPKDMMWDPMWKSLKNATRSLFDGWLTEADGAGDGGYVDLSKGINFGFARTAAQARAMGYPFPRPHLGLDINYKYGEKLYSTLAGKGTGKSGYNGGFGNSMWLNNGKGLEAIYGHMSKLAWNGTKNVKPGTYLGKVGSTGDSTGPHLHYEMRRNGEAFDPTKWLKENNGGGQNKSASKWKGEIKKAAKKMKVNLSNRELQGIIAQIQRESNGNAGVTQGNIGDINNLRGTPAQGLLQYVPSTFNAYKMKGYGNIKNGYHQLLAFFNNSNWRRDLPYGKSGWGPSGSRRFAVGTNSAPRGLAQVFEKGGEIMNLRGGEQIIPNDVSIAAIKQIISSNIFNKTQQAVFAGISRYADALRNKEESARIKEMKAQQLANANTTDINELKAMVADMVFLMQQQLGVQENIAGTNQQIANKDTTLDGKKMTKEVSEQEAFNLLMRNYNSGVTKR